MTSRYMIPTWEVVSGAVDGSVNQARAIPDTLEKLLLNAEDVPVESATPLRQAFYFANIGGAGTASKTWVAPFDCEVHFTGGYKPASTGGAGDKVELKSGSNVISTWDLATVAAPAQVQGSMVYAYRLVSKGDILTLLQTDAAAGDSSAYVWFDIIPQ